MSVVDYKAAKSNLDKKETDIEMARRKRQNEIFNKTQTVKEASAKLEEKLEHLHS
jgi:prefoldin subunit 5